MVPVAVGNAVSGGLVAHLMQQLILQDPGYQKTELMSPQEGELSGSRVRIPHKRALAGRAGRRGSIWSRLQLMQKHRTLQPLLALLRAPGAPREGQSDCSSAHKIHQGRAHTEQPTDSPRASHSEQKPSCGFLCRLRLIFWGVHYIGRDDGRALLPCKRLAHNSA